MSKAMIEIEKPKCCKDCVWYQADPWFGGSCKITKKESGWNKTIGADEEYNVQKWCPLLPKNDVIPVKWIKEQLEKEEYRGFLVDHIEWHECLCWLIDKWEKENGTCK